MENILKSALTLSILSTPQKLGLWDTITLKPHEVLNQIPPEKLKTMDIINQRYPGNPDKSSDLIINACARKKIRILTLWDDEYPHMLKQIHNPPLVLYVKGHLYGKKMISIVGTRGSDEKSEEITKIISGRASLMGCTIVSGMALGIDRNAHLGALMAGGGTIAVLPGGVDVIYPYKNSDIYRMIGESPLSAVVSEYPPGTGSGQKWTFARRNRLISGLSDAVIVIQAPVKSGAMITARYAIEQNRDLFACPGNAFDEKYSGCNELIRQGAAIFSDMNDLFSDVEPFSINDKFQIIENKMTEKCDNKKIDNNKKETLIHPIVFSGKAAERIYEDLKGIDLDVDEFIRNNSFSADEVNRAITELEIAGYLDRKGNRLYKI